MNRKLAGILGALVALAVAVWFFAIRDHGRAPARPAPVASGGGAPAPGLARPPQPDGPAPQGMTPRWVLDVDREGPLRLEGQVVDADGHGVGDAVVTLSTVPPRTAKTEGDGTFAFDRLVGREYALSAVAGTRVGGPVPYHLTPTSDPVILRLVVGGKLAVTVVDGTSDRPVPDASVRVLAATEVSGKTGADGTITLAPVHPDWAAVQVTAPGYAPGSGFVQVGGAGATAQLKVVLRKGFAVSGRVLDERGTPVADARVTTAGIYDLPGTLDPVITDAKGAFSFAALAPGTHTLVATDGEHAPARSAPITIGDRVVTGIEIVMQAGGTLAGTVVDVAGTPVAFATVRVAGDGQQMWLTDSRQTSTGKDGAFELRGLSRHKLRVRAEAEAGASAITAIDLTTQADRRDVQLVLDVKGTIAGIVVDEKNEPVAEIQVNAFPDILGGESGDGIALAGMTSATTDGGGRFTIRGLPEGAYRLRAARAARGRYDWGMEGTAARTGDTGVTITLATPGSVTGTLALEAGGKPPALATVQLGQQAPVTARADGTFTLEDVAPGRYDLRVRGPEFATLSKRDVVVEAGKSTDTGTLTLVRGRKLTGRVVDGAGAPVAGAKIKTGDMLFALQGAEDQMESFEEMAGMRTGITDQDGRFTLIGIAKKATSVLADHATRGRSSAVEIPAGTDDPPALTLTLRGYGSITGKVTSQGKPVGGASVTATPKGGGAQVQIVQSNADGSFTLTRISEGSVVVGAMQQSLMSMKSTSITVEVKAGAQTTANIDIPVGDVTLVVDIKPQAGQQVDSAQVFLFRGVVALKNAKQLTDAFLGGGAQGMKFWFGAGKPLPAFDELVAGDYSVCTIPITGDLNDATLQARLQQHMDALLVYCKQARVAPSPAKQTVVHEVPAMAPIPAD